VTLPETATLREFAGIARFRPSYVTQLKAEDRLVLTEDGKRVRVAESLARIEATKDPAKIGVAARHAAARTESGHDQAAQSAPKAPPPQAAESGDDTVTTAGFQHWRERSERAKALSAERENALAEGKLMQAEDVVHAVNAHVTMLRTRLEALPDVVAPQLAAARDESHVRSLLAESIEHALAEMSRQFGELARAA
jgi:hypothetical protein